MVWNADSLKFFSGHWPIKCVLFDLVANEKFSELAIHTILRRKKFEIMGIKTTETNLVFCY